MRALVCIALLAATATQAAIWTTLRNAAPGTPTYMRQLAAARSWCTQDRVYFLVCDDVDIEFADALASQTCAEVLSGCKSRDGIPYVNSMFELADTIDDDMLVYANADCIMRPEFMYVARTGVGLLAQSRFLFVGARIAVPQGWDLVDRPQYKVGHPDAVDVFVYSPDLFRHMPDFLIATAAWDNWVLVNSGVKGVDMSGAGGVVWHQDHAPNRERAADNVYNRDLAKSHGGFEKGSPHDLPYYMALCNGTRVRHLTPPADLCLFER